MILIYALAKRDQISGSGRVSRWSGGGFLAYNIGIFTRGYIMEILFLLCALGFAVSFFGFGIMFACWISEKIPHAPCDERGEISDEKA